jgi:hypothetical protein
MNNLRTTVLLAGLLASTPAALAQPFTIDWWTVDGGGASVQAGGTFSLGGTTGQPDAGPSMSGGTFTLSGGFWAAGAPACYVNCDASTTPPVLNINDFLCFLNRYAAGDVYANCDGSTTPPIMNVLDFICFQSRFAAGCP